MQHHFLRVTLGGRHPIRVIEKYLNVLPRLGIQNVQTYSKSAGDILLPCISPGIASEGDLQNKTKPELISSLYHFNRSFFVWMKNRRKWCSCKHTFQTK